MNDHEPVEELLGRGQRRKPGLPRRYRDEIPVGPAPIPPPVPTPAPPQSDAVPAIHIPEPLEVIRTERNAFGVFREYIGRPSHDPDQFVSIDDLSDIRRARREPNHDAILEETSEELERPWYLPAKNPSTFRILDWANNGNNSKSTSQMQILFDDVLGAPDFNRAEVLGVKVKRETARFDEAMAEDEDRGTGWIHTEVSIQIPDGKRHDSYDDVSTFQVGGVSLRKIVPIVREIFADRKAEEYHLTPFREFWQPDEGGPAKRVLNNLYTTDIYIQAHEEVNAIPREPGDVHERVIVALMLYSDSTRLAQFGSASLWPIYLFLGNQSMLARELHHLAYLPKLPEELLRDYWLKHTDGDGLSADVITHCRRELMQAIVNIILQDKEFQEACRKGILVTCWDGIKRRLFPRLFTYSADYPEKVLLASIKSLSHCPCPRCCVPKSRASEVGMKRNADAIVKFARVDDQHHREKVSLARDFVYLQGYGMKSKAVEDLLGSQSLVPTKNAFSEAFHSAPIAPKNLNYFQIFPIDIMHQFEIGVWKAIYIHLLRILVAEKNRGNLITILNSRYRQVPKFARETIRLFQKSVAAMQQPTAHQFESILKCALPTFEALLPPPHDELVLDLLFILATWHGLAKLRTHTVDTLSILKITTTTLGSLLRKFKRTTCEEYDTRELDKKTFGDLKKGRKPRAPAKATTGANKGKGKQKAAGGPEESDKEDAPLQKKKVSKKKELNLDTAKIHELEHCVPDIWMFGATGSFSAEPGEMEHKIVKVFYGKTNKINASKDISRYEQRRAAFKLIGNRDPHRLADAYRRRGKKKKGKGKRAMKPKRGDAAVEPGDPNLHYHIPAAFSSKLNIPTWLSNHPGDPALKNFYNRLRDHLLGRCHGREFDGDEHQFSTEERNDIRVEYDELREHTTMNVNYTTYDGRRNQDLFNPRTRPDVMVLSREEGPDAHPFWYAKIIKIFSLTFKYVPPGVAPWDAPRQSVHVLWVRWYGRDTNAAAGWKKRRLHTVGFVPGNDDAAFGFLDPSQIVRGVHLIPAFAYGRTKEMLGESICRGVKEEHEDWKFLYVNCFADRDMLMRFMGTGINHGRSRQVDHEIQQMIESQNTGEESESDVGEDPEEPDTSASLAGPSEPTRRFTIRIPAPRGSARKEANDELEGGEHGNDYEVDEYELDEDEQNFADPVSDEGDHDDASEQEADIRDELADSEEEEASSSESQSDSSDSLEYE
ncbi:hypothetical protein SCHPADRAFT_839152 [Schizopora paradoxa]|uniref:Uncharacterized protein n=1 Tax=Schizopora paradoxa TaxID=27342 RepID=A0A0H2R1K3_9AGAM|nr:hypothetical protein SCHPADRAFT_839152 [Schizopora paradoxa]